MTVVAVVVATPVHYSDDRTYFLYWKDGAHTGLLGHVDAVADPWMIARMMKEAVAVVEVVRPVRRDHSGTMVEMNYYYFYC